MAKLDKLQRILDLMESEPNKTAAAKKAKMSNGHFNKLLTEAQRMQSLNLL